MTAHELAKYLLKCPDLPVDINGWGSDEGYSHEVTGAGISNKDNPWGYAADPTYTGERLFLGHGEHHAETGKLVRDWAMSEQRL